VTGPKRVLAKATEINTVPVSLSNLPPIADQAIPGAAKVEQYVEIKVDNKSQRERIDCNQSVEYWITLSPIRESKVFKKVPVRIMMPANFPYLARPVQSQETVDVEVRGLKQSLSKLDPTNVKAYVDVTDKRPAAPVGGPPTPVSLPVLVILPDEVQGKVEIVNEPQKMVGVDILEPPTKKEGPLAPPR